VSEPTDDFQELVFPADWKQPAPRLETEPEKPPLDIRRVRPKPVASQAVLATTENMRQIVEWVESNGHDATLGIDQLILQTFEGPFTIRPGDVVLRKPSGAFVREEGEPEIFDAAYEDLGPVTS
jgi:hypothetical protein